MNTLVGTSFWLTVYGSQTFVNLLRTAHSFAVFTKKDLFDDGSTPETSQIISWLPASGVIHLVGQEVGRNYTLAETLDFVGAEGAKIHVIPPVTITEALYNSALARIQELESGSVAFVMADSFSTRPQIATNCIHAISDLPIALQEKAMLDTGILHGLNASRAVYDYLSDWFLSPPAGVVPPATIEGAEVVGDA